MKYKMVKYFTDFQCSVFEEIKKIPKGQTVTYKQIAEKIGKPRAYRAVANACGRNPDPETIPCHRVVRSDGGIGGYSLKGGVAKKRKLLMSENQSSKNF
tara:strand:- start:518 stop:814 length:297 start_codon:yes stop_codon:yes gene_type:complete